MINENELIADSHGRSFKTLRVSLTSSCNLACLYCVEGGAKNSIKKPEGNEVLRLEEYLNIIKKIHERVGLETIRLTGGEPLLYNNIAELITGIKKIGILQVKLTTNGTLLSKMASELSDAGLDSANVSLDAANPVSFQNITRRKSIEKVIEGIDEAVKCGINLKINSVIMKNVNDDQVLPLLGFAKDRNLVIRYLELMKMGHLYDKHNSFFFSQAEILKEILLYHKINSLERGPGATARYWKTNSGQIFGVIANESQPFCHDCNRLRLDSYGNIYGCLSNSIGIPISHVIEEKAELDESLRMALAQKQEVKFTGSKISMKYIGG
jgi:cyclic pyranopterin phosphate synthase